ncbi:transcriptional regulator [Anoxybacillus sp. UARK-01]|uniref:YycH family regulatory protein n=1 Tax=Anoxybacillus sp. UARK-01 TaxID=1895648 RepID=UPI0009BB4E30|nr:two-component system activity regulator YycH [Anoxybacillus sp. UARK-01]OQM44471.1 transcriptional regulator [Anoxybacillus sp. UARK-01]
MNGMRYETAKTIVLTVLVLTSILFTWGLWTYHPKYDVIQNGEYVQNVSVSNAQVDPSMIVRPSQILIHKNAAHYGLIEETEINKLFKNMKKWTFDDFENVSSTVSKESFLSFIHGRGKIEIIYPDEIPMNIYQTIFQIDDRGLDSIGFDTIIIPVEKHSSLTVYFVSTERRKIYKATAKDVPFEEINQLYEHTEKLPRYFAYNVSETKTLFLPEKEMTMDRLQYYTDELDTDKFKEALFSDPSFVKKDILTFGEEYTDGSRLMDVDFLQKLLLYVNPAAKYTIGPSSEESASLIQKSIDFVNEHGGWTDMYHFVQWDREERKIVFRLFVNNHPVFNNYGMSEIVQIWGAAEINKYQRPLFRLEIPDRTSVPVQLQSGRQVIQQLEKIKGFKKELLTEVTLGYELVKDQEREKVVVLEPDWFYLYNGTWKKFSDDDSEEMRGGNAVGLE